jgi:hypothetical protein
MNGVVPLLNIGDPDVTRLAIYRYQSRIVGGFPERALAKSSNPDIIPLIGDNLNKIESPDGDEIREDIAVKPLSISSATIIRRIIIQSSSFSPAVTTWANNLSPSLTNDQFRQQMRLWWNENKSLLKAKRYGEVRPPR